MTMDEKVVAAGSSSSSSQKRATLDAGRKKLEEFRRKKEEQQEMRSQQAKLVDAQPILAEKAKEREEDLKQQCSELLASVDDLHRALNDERYNSSQLEGTIADLRRELSVKAEEKAGQDDRVVELEGELSELVEQLEAMVKEREERDDDASDEEVAGYKRRIEALEAELSAMSEQIKEQSDLKGEIADLTLRLEALAGDKAALEETNARMESELRERSAESEVLIEKIASHKAELSAMSEQIKEQSDLKGEIADLTLRLEALAGDKAALEETNARMESELRERSAESEVLIEKIASLEEELADNAAPASNPEASDEFLARLEEMSKEKETLMDASVKMEEELTSASVLVEEAVKQKEAAEKELADVLGRLVDLQASAAAVTAAPSAPDPRLEQEVAALKAENASLLVKVQANQTASLQSSEHKQKAEQLASMTAELARVKDSLAAEKRRATQLEELAATRSAGNKKLDDDHDMEAAALAGGGAFKPLVGIVRSLPPTLGNNPFINEAAKKLDKATVALDARPAIRAAVILYIALLHLLLLI